MVAHACSGCGRAQVNIRSLARGFWTWIDCVATIANENLERVRGMQCVRLVEEDTDRFRIELPAGKTSGPVHIADGRISEELADFVTKALRGGRVELALHPRRFLFQSLDLPKRAAEFLEGVVRSQLDRLTPWTAEEAAFGWAPAAEISKDRIAVTIAATPRTSVEPYLRALCDLGVRSIAVSTSEPAGSCGIEVLSSKGNGTLGGVSMRRAIAGLLMAASASAFLGVTADQILGPIFDAQRDEALSRAADSRRIVSRIGSDGAQTLQHMLELHKRETPSTVIVLEELSRVLPDHTFATELRVDGDKLQIVGITHDAPSLIRLIEQSPQFTRATFFAPTTRSPTDPGERFHIEARITRSFAIQR